MPYSQQANSSLDPRNSACYLRPVSPVSKTMRSHILLEVIARRIEYASLLAGPGGRPLEHIKTHSLWRTHDGGGFAPDARMPWLLASERHNGNGQTYEAIECNQYSTALLFGEMPRFEAECKLIY